MCTETLFINLRDVQIQHKWTLWLPHYHYLCTGRIYTTHSTSTITLSEWRGRGRERWGRRRQSGRRGRGRVIYRLGRGVQGEVGRPACLIMKESHRDTARINVQDNMVGEDGSEVDGEVWFLSREKENGIYSLWAENGSVRLSSKRGLRVPVSSDSLLQMLEKFFFEYF